MSQADIKKVIAQEYVRCMQDPAHFMKKYCYIQHPNRGRIHFHLYLFQEKVLHLFRDNQNIIVLKSRQLGLSTLSAAYALWLMIFHKDKNVLALATTQATARNLVTKVQFMYENLPKWLRIKSVENNRLSLRLSNGSRIKAASSSSDSARSEAVSLLIIDEAAFIDNIEETFASAQQTLATGGQAIVLSCVVGNTLVVTGKGIQEVQDFADKGQVIEPYQVLGRDRLRSGNLFHNNGYVETRKIDTTFSFLEGSNNHKIFTHRQGKAGWTRMDELQEGDLIAIYYGSRVWGNNDVLNFDQKRGSKKLPFPLEKITPELAYLFGLYLAEGSYDKKHEYFVDITCGDDISKSLEALNLTWSTSKLSKRISYSGFVELLKYIGFQKATASEKQIPKRLLQISEPCITAMVRGMFDGDGTCTSKNQGMIGYVSTSEKLIDTLRVILLNLGILSKKRIRTATSANKYVEEKAKSGKEWAKKWSKHNYDAFYLEIDDTDSIETFHSLIGFGIHRKQLILENLIEKRKNQTRKSTKDIVPGVRRLVQTLQERSELSQNEFSRQVNKSLGNILNRTTSRNTEHISRHVFSQIYSKFKHLLTQEELEYISQIYHPNIKWTQILSIEKGYSETFDFSLPDDPNDFWCHSVVYNGILGHQTPNGVGNWFHRTWQKAETKENTFLPVKLPWTVHPERNQTWRDQQDADLGPRLASQECDTDFLSSGDTVFLPEDLLYYETTGIVDPMERRGVDGNLWVWESPDYSKDYMVVADVARGDSSDYSAFHVFDIENAVQVAEYKGKISPKDFGNVLVGIASEYNEALLVIENANIGWATIEQVLQREYRNLYYSSRTDNDTVESYMNKFENDKLVPGFTQSARTRPLVIAKMMEYIRDRSVTLNSKRLLEEMRVFVWKNGKAQAQIGYNDDLIMAFGIGLYVRDTALRLRQQGMDLARAQLSSFTNINQRSSKVITTSNKTSNPYDVPTPYGNHDISWLLK